MTAEAPTPPAAGRPSRAAQDVIDLRLKHRARMEARRAQRQPAASGGATPETPRTTPNSTSPPLNVPPRIAVADAMKLPLDQELTEEELIGVQREHLDKLANPSLSEDIRHDSAMRLLANMILYPMVAETMIPLLQQRLAADQSLLPWIADNAPEITKILADPFILASLRQEYTATHTGIPSTTVTRSTAQEKLGTTATPGETPHPLNVSIDMDGKAREEMAARAEQLRIALGMGDSSSPPR